MEGKLEEENPAKDSEGAEPTSKKRQRDHDDDGEEERSKDKKLKEDLDTGKEDSKGGGRNRDRGRRARAREFSDSDSAREDRKASGRTTDAFGRAVPRGRDVSSSDSSDRSDDDHYRRGGGGRRGRGRRGRSGSSDEPPRRRGRYSRSPRPSRRGGSPSRSRSRGRRGDSPLLRRSGPSPRRYRSRSPNTPPYKRRRFGAHDRRMPARGRVPQMNGAAPYHTMGGNPLTTFNGPLLAFSEFLMHQSDHMSPEKSLAKYNEYKEAYNKKWEKRFFNEHSTEEWFQKLYLNSQIAKIKDAFRESIPQRYKAFESQARDQNPESISYTIKKDDGEQDQKFFRNCVLIKFVPPRCTEAALVKVFKDQPGFQSVTMFPPEKESRDFSRSGWIKFTSQEECEDAVKELNKKSIDVAELRLFPAERPKDLVIPRFTNDEKNMKADLELSRKLAERLDRKHGVWKTADPSFVLDEGYLEALTLPQRLDTVLLYLRHVHLFCFYSKKHFFSMEEMVYRTGEKLRRDGESVDEKEWYHNLKTEIKKHIDDSDNEEVEDFKKYEEEFLQEKTLELDEPNKYRCRLCTKLFKAAMFVHKHIRNRHTSELNQAMLKAQEEKCFENYRADPNKLLRIPNFPPHPMPRVPNYPRPIMPMPMQPALLPMPTIRVPPPHIAMRDVGRERRRTPPRRERSPPRRNRSPPPRRPPNRDLVKYDDIDAPQEEDIVVDYGYEMNLDDLDD